METFEVKKSIIERFSEKLREYKRVIDVSKRPTMHEFRLILKITGIGIVIIGVIGFTIRMAANIIK